MENYPTKTSVVAFMQMDDQTRIGVATERVANARDLGLLGLEIIEGFTGITAEEIKAGTKGPKFFFTDDRQNVIAGMSIDTTKDGEWGFILIDEQMAASVMPEMFSGVSKLN